MVMHRLLVSLVYGQNYGLESGHAGHAADYCRYDG